MICDGAQSKLLRKHLTKKELLDSKRVWELLNDGAGAYTLRVYVIGGHVWRSRITPASENLDSALRCEVWAMREAMAAA